MALTRICNLKATINNMVSITGYVLVLDPIKANILVKTEKNIIQNTQNQYVSFSLNLDKMAYIIQREMVYREMIIKRK